VLVRRLSALLVFVALSATAAISAFATPPGSNGRIVFTSSRAGNSELYSISADGTAGRRLTWTPATEQAPAWSPDGSRIVYESDAGGRFRIFVMNADGTGATEISPAASYLDDDMEPTWSPDATRIAFASTRGGTWNIWVMNADGSGLRRVSDAFGFAPAWSPDGRRIAYSGLSGIWTIGVDGTGAQLVSAPGASPSAPSWSPDGREIVFSRNNAAGYPGELYVAALDGSHERQLTSDGYENAAPSWSPDGTQIVFQRSGGSFGDWWLESIGADGTGLQRVTAGPGDLGPDWGSATTVPEPSPPDAPTIQIFSPGDGAWYLPEMTAPAFYLCSSAVSFVVSCEGDVPFGAPLDLSVTGQRTFTVRATDAEGRTASSSVSFQVLDIEPPSVEIQTPREGASYSLGQPVTVDFSCSDGTGSGVAECEGERPNGAPLDTSSIGTHTFHVVALDRAGNSRFETSTYTVVDPQPPSVEIASPADGATYRIGEAVTAGYSCRPAGGAQLASCTGTVPSGSAVDTSSVGTKTFTVSAADDAGRTTVRTQTYRVVYDFGGFTAPVDAAALNEFSAGEGIPLKFSLGADYGLGAVAGGSLTWQPIACGDAGPAGGRSAAQGKLSYNTSTGRYLYVAATDPSWSGTCRRLDLVLADGTTHPVRVHFVK
jgi:Tol biopolymer transport system component